MIDFCINWSIRLGTVLFLYAQRSLEFYRFFGQMEQRNTFISDENMILGNGF